MANDIIHLSMCLLVIQIFSLVKYPFKNLPILQLVYLFIIISQKFLMYSRYKSSDMSYIFTFLMISLEAQRFSILMKSVYQFFSFIACAFGIISKKSLPNPTMF